MSAPKPYRKKPVVIEAMQIPSYGGDVTEYLKESVRIAKWCDGISRMMVNDNEKYFSTSPVTGPHIVVPTLEGDMIARPQDYIIKGVNGEFYPCKPDIFAKTYEEVS